MPVTSGGQFEVGGRTREGASFGGGGARRHHRRQLVLFRAETVTSTLNCNFLCVAREAVCGGGVWQAATPTANVF